VTPSLQKYPGTVSISAGAYRGFLAGVLRELARNRFKNIIILNGHGGNTGAIKEVLSEISGELNARFLVINWWSLTEQETQEVFKQRGGHAGNNETAYMQAIVPNHIHPERYRKDMAIPNPVGTSWFAYPFPASIGLYKAGEGYPTFSKKQAEAYFKKVNDRVAHTIETIIKKWDAAGL
jgi:creatinine amidohydrolase